MNIKILVASHKDAPMPSDKIYLPILVGSDRNYNGQKNFQLDNQGENISAKNPNYNELTAIYWAWKNLKDVDAVGLVHYRRFFSEHHKRNIDYVLTKNQVKKLLKQAPVVVPRKRNYFIESNFSHYVHAHHKEPLLETRVVIKKYYPQYLKSFDKIINSKKAHMFNMFIMETNYFNSYCDFVFGVLGKVEKSIDISDYSVQEARVFGYLAELLMDVWISTNNVNYVECNWIQLGERKLVKKAINFMKRKVGIDGNTHF